MYDVWIVSVCDLELLREVAELTMTFVCFGIHAHLITVLVCSLNVCSHVVDRCSLCSLLLRC